MTIQEFKAAAPINGEKVKSRRDGTFSAYRVQLPAAYELKDPTVSTAGFFIRMQENLMSS